ncbi:MAG: ParB/RepB/Spo0J family partition protein [Planctomycetaceae bacterium]|nr:ParB/RepB/Spo0J family partition protein [Planctomycetaceae bacterium]
MTDIKKLKKPHLGRGLEALLGPITRQPPQIDPSVLVAGFPPDVRMELSRNELPIEKIVPNPFQPRTVWDESQLAELTASVKENGILQPILVRKAEKGFEIIAGERRYRAAVAAGLQTIPALVRQATDDEMLELALVENIHRTDLNPIERAKAYQNFVNTFNLSQTDAAKRLGEDRTVVVNYLRLLDLPSDIRDMLSAGQLTMGHARAILALPTDELRRKLANRAMAGRLSVREVERLVRRYVNEKTEEPILKKDKKAHIVDLEKRLQSLLGTKVCIQPNKRGQRGRIIIDYYSLDEFERLTERMGMSSTESL